MYSQVVMWSMRPSSPGGRKRVVAGTLTLAAYTMLQAPCLAYPSSGGGPEHIVEPGGNSTMYKLPLPGFPLHFGRWPTAPRSALLASRTMSMMAALVSLRLRVDSLVSLARPGVG